MIPGVTIKTGNLRTAVMFGDCGDGLYWVEPMRFLYPYEAKREADAAERPKGNPSRCHHNYRKAIREAIA